MIFLVVTFPAALPFLVVAFRLVVVFLTTFLVVVFLITFLVVALRLVDAGGR
ncbi:hypothetical protein DFJ74DRAFT_671414 [Hyaloraphidium curvatum]|nr:hypothetical protein DFJ74DRAFT_671414 [Hyaloraphidium curvatum]